MHLHHSFRSRAVEPLERRVLFSATDLVNDFGRDGVVRVNLNDGIDNARAVALQSDGKIIVAGDASFTGTSNPREGFFAARFNTDGSLDDGGDADLTPKDHFGTDGLFSYGTGSGAFATAVAVQPDGKIILAGYADSTGTNAQQYWLLMRLNTDGTLDKTFGDGGVAGFEFGLDNTPLAGIALQSDGKIVAIGTDNGNFLVARFTTTGQFDSTFGQGGSVTTDFGGGDSATALAVDPYGRIDVVGGVDGDGLNQQIGIARYLSNGTLDPTFGIGGKVISPGANGDTRIDVASLALNYDGDLLVGENGFEPEAGNQWTAWVCDFNDTGTSGENVGNGEAQMHALAALPDGGYFYAANQSNTGQSDAFEVGSSDAISGSTPLSNASATALAVAPDGSVFAAGYQDVKSGERDFVLAKFAGANSSTYGTITGHVFADIDGDGVQDTNEKPMSHIRVYIDSNLDGKWDADGLGNEETFTFTDSHGNFTLPVDFTDSVHLREVLPAGYNYSLPAAHVYIDKVALGKTVASNNFGNQPIPTPSTITAIEGDVFDDLNGNKKRDIVDPIEPNLAGIVVFIDSNDNGKLDSGELQTTTDASGNFTLKLPKAGKYHVAVVVPKHYKSTTAATFYLTVHTHTQAFEQFGLLRI